MNPINMNEARKLLADPDTSVKDLRDLAEAALDEVQTWRATYNDFTASVPMQTQKPSKVLLDFQQEMERKRQLEDSSRSQPYVETKK